MTFRRAAFKAVMHPTLWVGRVQAWLAEGYNDHTITSVERSLIFPSWALFRGMFRAGFKLARLVDDE